MGHAGENVTPRRVLWGTMSILASQPDAGRYYAEGYWRPGDLWSEFAARVSLAPAKTALVVGERNISYAGLERAAVTLSGRLAAHSIGPGDVVLARFEPTGPGQWYSRSLGGMMLTR